MSNWNRKYMLVHDFRYLLGYNGLNNIIFEHVAADLQSVFEYSSGYINHHRSNLWGRACISKLRIYNWTVVHQ